MIQKGMTKDFQILTPYTDDAGASYVVTQNPVYSPPPLGIDPDKIPTGTSVISEPYVDTKPIKSTGSIQGGLYPECLAKWEKVAMVTKFESTQAMEDAKNRFMTDCMGSSTTGTSAIVEPEIVTPSGTSTTNFLPNLGGFLGSLTGGGAGGGATEEEVLTPNKKPFPYWIIAVAVVGGYLIFRKK
jgi:hypothetical protein